MNLEYLTSSQVMQLQGFNFSCSNLGGKYAFMTTEDSNFGQVPGLPCRRSTN